MPADWMLCETDRDRDEWEQEQARREEIAHEEREHDRYRLRPPNPADSQEDRSCPVCGWGAGSYPCRCMRERVKEASA